ncbi:MAG: aminopeptidase N [Alphaproteobacteria bacterium]|nr:aminopeptidase N [Alphaproteobacteria bacterium]
MDATEGPRATRLADYRPPDYRIDHVALEVDLDPGATRVAATLAIRAAGETGPELRLDGADLALRALRIDGRPLDATEYAVDDTGLTIHRPPARFTLEIDATIDPRGNTRLEGLYLSNGIFTTQCEAEGFRRITYFLDRPDVMSTYRVAVRGDRASLPVLLSNGNLVSTADLGDGRHEAVWDDPFPKPAYLFALVAGDLALVEDRFVTRSGRTVTLRIYVEHGNERRCDYAMDSLKRSMRWDEEAFGLEYDLDLFNIVAVSHFNMGAMENKSLNVFNARYILADPETATDLDFARIEAVVAHEYFHNWTGNRVTCRDWFQLSLKEGLTVFRDQLFVADMRSSSVKRIEEVRALRARQFAEDAGPLAHPVRPDSYIEINNFYTATVYEKGAEVIRMMHRILGPAGFRRGMDLYFARHDGEAVTCDDFVAAMADANGVDLGRFKRWYVQAGTPEIAARWRWDPASHALDLTLAQTTRPTPGQPAKEPLHLPIAVGLIGADGAAVPLRLAGETEAAGTMRVLALVEPEETWRFLDVPSPPVPSLNRGFSAPVALRADYSVDELAFLMARDEDLFNRWEAGQQFATRLLLERASGGGTVAESAFVAAIGRILDETGRDPAFVAEAIRLPSEDFLIEQMRTIDVEAVHATREHLRRTIATALEPALRAAYRANQSNRPYSPEAGEAARRALKNEALSYLACLRTDETIALVAAQYRSADNMTDRAAALAILADLDAPAREEAFDDFYRRFKDDALVVDKWLSLQATSARPDTVAVVRALLGHGAFSYDNPNKVRALVGAFANGNPLRFNAADGSGYRLVGEVVATLDPKNPRIGARLVGAFGRWRRFDPGRQALMRGELERILALPGLSQDTYEIASKTLA